MLRRSNRKRKPAVPHTVLTSAVGAAAKRRVPANPAPLPVVANQMSSSTYPLPVVANQTPSAMSTGVSAAHGPAPRLSSVVIPDLSVSPHIMQIPPPVSTTGNTVNPTIHTVTHDIHTPNQISSIFEDVASNVQQNIREKISKSEYIDIATLLTTNNDAKNTATVVWREGRLVVLPPQNTVKIQTIEQWTSAFILFISVYCRTHPNRFQELLKYLYMVRVGASRCPANSLGWKAYDEQFRLRKACDPTSSWAVVDVELWLLYISSGSVNNQAFNNRFSFSNFSMKCYSFNYSGRCFRQACPYNHLCLRCSGSHPVVNCPVKGPVKQKASGSNFNAASQTRFYSRGPNQTVTSQNFTFRHPQYHARPRFTFTPVGQGSHSDQY